jgi:DMSO/TMAO reductase YedYZ molybdopterin-dependent catalytic subunit
MSGSNLRDTLPAHDIPEGISPVIRVCGLVAEPMTLNVSDLDQLPLVTAVDDFTCLEGWSVPALEWRGPQLAAVVRLARLPSQAAYVTVAAADFATSLPLADVLNGTGVLALYLGGKPVPKAHGGPFRLIVPGRECFTSIKWVDRVELTAAPVETGERIARDRLAQGLRNTTR